MSPPPITSHVPQSLDIVLQLSSQIVLQRHRTQFAGHIVDLLIGEISDARGFVDVEAGHEALADFGTDAIEGAERAIDKRAFEEIDAEDEDLHMLEAVVDWCEYDTYHFGDGKR